MSMFSPQMLLVPLVASAASIPTFAGLTTVAGFPLSGGVPGATGVSSLAAPRPDNAVVHRISLTPEQERSIVRYWTVDRMVHARPPSHAVRQRASRPAVPSVPQAMGGVVGGSSVQQDSAAAPSSSSGGAMWPSGGAVRDTSGKVFFTLDGRDYVCSASTVTSHNRDLVVTAGHCAKDGTGDWAENWIFVPGYRGGSGPYGGFTARKLYVPDQWSGQAADDYDVAMVTLATSGGRHVTDVVGAQGIAFGQPRGRQIYAFGYPATGSYDGESLVYCSGRPHNDPHGLVSGQGLRCDMTQGSSGGAWLSQFDSASGHGVITSVSSFKYADDNATMYGPYFGGTVHALYDQAQHG